MIRIFKSFPSHNHNNQNKIGELERILQKSLIRSVICPLDISLSLPTSLSVPVVDGAEEQRGTGRNGYLFMDFSQSREGKGREEKGRERRGGRGVGKHI